MANTKKLEIHVFESTEVGFLGLSRFRQTEVIKGDVTAEEFKQIKGIVKKDDA